MNKTEENPQERRKGVFLLLLPLLVLPILFLLNWKFSPVQASDLSQPKGLNTVLPEPQIKDFNSTKAEAYAFQKTVDSKKTELSWTLPNLGFGDMSDEEGFEYESENLQYPKRFSSNPEITNTPDFNDVGTGKVSGLNLEEKLIQERLGQIQKILDSQDLNKLELEDSVSENPNPEILRLEQLMIEGLAGRPKEPDPELVQLENLMDKILQIQYPDRVPQEISISEQPILALPKESQNNHSTLNAASPAEEIIPELENGFFGLEESINSGETESQGAQTTFAAEVSRTQEILPGEAIEILLLEDLALGNQLITSGTTVYGTTSLSGNRLQITVSGVLWKKDIIPVSLKAYGLDALPGLEVNFVKGSSQVLEEGKSDLQNINLGTIGMDWEAQVANSGINATRKFLDSKSKSKPLSIKGGHPLLLVNSNSNSNR